MVVRGKDERRTKALLAGALSAVLFPAGCNNSDDVSNQAPKAHPPSEAVGDSRLALRAEDRSKLTKVLVMAHVGSVIMRREGASWVTAGEHGCTVPPGRIERAFDNLAGVKAVPSGEKPTSGSVFELQIMALMGEERAIHFEIADRNEHGDLVQLHDASTFRVSGLDRALWSPRPEDWCTE
jgi:hypothetical protein